MKIQNNAPIQPALTQPTAPAADADAASIASPPPEKAGIFDGIGSKLSSLFTPAPSHNGGDSRLVMPAGGGYGEISQQEAIDANSRKSGDFTEERHVDGKTLYFTPDGAKAVDTMLARAEEANAHLHAEKDPGGWEKFFKGDLFAGKEQYSGKTE